MVRVLVRPRGSSVSPSPRFIPLEIFGLWELLMSERHRFEVLDRRASVWIDVEDQPDMSFSSGQFERVDEVCLHVFSEKDGMFQRVCRYFRAEERDRLTGVLLKHYASHVYEDARRPQIAERAGIWIVRGG
jgi:hypothetical protein